MGPSGPVSKKGRRLGPYTNRVSVGSSPMSIGRAHTPHSGPGKSSFGEPIIRSCVSVHERAPCPRLFGCAHDRCELRRGHRHVRRGDVEFVELRHLALGFSEMKIPSGFGLLSLSPFCFQGFFSCVRVRISQRARASTQGALAFACFFWGPWRPRLEGPPGGPVWRAPLEAPWRPPLEGPLEAPWRHPGGAA